MPKVFTINGSHIEIFQGEKGMVRITLSEEKWVLLENHFHARCEELHELKEKAKKGRQQLKGGSNG